MFILQIVTAAQVSTTKNQRSVKLIIIKYALLFKKSYNNNTPAGVFILEMAAELGCTIRDMEFTEPLEVFI